MENAMSIYAELMFLEVIIKPELCPIAMDRSLCIYNHIPNTSTGLDPTELWSDHGLVLDSNLSVILS